MPPAKKATPAAAKKPDTTAPEPEVTEPEAPVDLIAAWNEPTPDELEAAGKYGITVDQLREIRAQAEADIRAAVVAKQDSGEIPNAAFCGLCLPGGWPDGADHMDCPHGTWKR